MTVRASFVRVRDAWRTAPPGAREFAVAPLVGTVAVALTNLVAVWVVLGRPKRLGLRIAAQLFDAVETLAVGVALAAIPALIAWWTGRAARRDGQSVRTRRGLVLGAYCVYGLAACVAMQWVFGDHLRRQADAAFEGRFATPLYLGMVLGSGFGLLAAQLVGAAARVLGARAAAFVALHGLTALVANHVALRDDYPNVHAAIAWVAMTAVGSAFAEPALAWCAHRRLVPFAVAGCGVLGVVVAPPNAVRLEMFRECGAVAPWVLSRAVWRLPPTPQVERVSLPPSDAPREAPMGAAASSTPLVEAPVVVLLTIDALRADVVSNADYEKRLPNFARLKKSGFYVARAVSPGSQTSVSLSALFSGRTFSSQRWTLYGEGSARFHYPATDESPRLPELLSAAGVRTEGFFALRFLSGDFGVVRGFGSEHMLTQGRKHAPASVVLPPLLGALDKVGPKESAFFFAHLTEPHEPYDRGSAREGTNFERYLSEIEVVDGWLGRILQRLGQRAKGRGYLVVSADHGEAFGEHGTEFHTKTLYDELLRVPLLVGGPRLPARRCEEGASLVDLGPTILGIFGFANALSPLGKNLLPRALGQEPCAGARPPIVAEGRLRRALYTADGLKVIEDHVRKTVEVFDLKADPGELENLFGADRRAEPALAELRAFFEAESLPNYEPPYQP